MNKEPLLFLCHRIPFPPNKGDKIRSFNILKKLSESYDIHLGCFIDDPFDEQYKGALTQYCKSVFSLTQNKTFSKVKGLTGFVTGKPITLPYYADGRMFTWTKDIVQAHCINKVFIYSSSMAQYCEGSMFESMTRVIDFVDVDSDKWRQYAEKKSGIAKWFFNREYRLLARYEDKICHEFDHSLFVSPDEAALFRERQLNQDKDKVHGLLNGVDVEFFDPDVAFEQENTPNAPFISFTGAMDYWANVESVVWFVKHVWPKVREAKPDALFYIVGGNPTQEVKDLASVDGVVITGRVHDIRPFIAQASCVVAPLRIARGIQNKVLEAMSLAKPVVSTTMAMEGINAPQNHSNIIVDEPQVMASACLSYLEKGQDATANRQWILENFTWEQTLAPLNNYLSPTETLV